MIYHKCMGVKNSLEYVRDFCKVCIDLSRGSTNRNQEEGIYMS